MAIHGARILYPSRSKMKIHALSFYHRCTGLLFLCAEFVGGHETWGMGKRQTLYYEGVASITLYLAMQVVRLTFLYYSWNLL